MEAHQASGDKSCARPRAAGHTALRRPFRLRSGLCLWRHRRFPHPLCPVWRDPAAGQHRDGLPRLYLQDADALHLQPEGPRRDQDRDGQDQARRYALRGAPRRGLAIAFIDVKVGNKLGIHDKAGMQFSATGDPTQEDCVDVSTNTTSYLLVMQANGMLKHHTVDATMSKANLGRGLMGLNPVKYWPHWSAILKEKKSGQKYAVDRWPFDQGENAAVVKVEDWYIKDRE